MKTIVFLATLVAVLTFNGCYALTGCPGSAQCDPNWVADATDGDNADGGVTAKGDGGSVTETKDIDYSEVNHNSTAEMQNAACSQYDWIESSGVWECPVKGLHKCTMKKYQHKWFVGPTGRCLFELICQNGEQGEGLLQWPKAKYDQGEWRADIFSDDHKTLYSIGCPSASPNDCHPVVYCTH